MILSGSSARVGRTVDRVTSFITVVGRVEEVCSVESFGLPSSVGLDRSSRTGPDGWSSRLARRDLHLRVEHNYANVQHICIAFYPFGKTLRKDFHLRIPLACLVQ